MADTTTVKAGWKTTEFWLSTVALVLGLVLASGALPDGGLAAQIVGGVLSVLAQLGYTAARAQVKAAEAAKGTAAAGGSSE